MKLLLDTSLLPEPKKGSGKARDALTAQVGEAADAGISAISLCAGAFCVRLKRGSAGEILWVEKLLDWLTVHPLDRAAAEAAAGVGEAALEDGLALLDADLLVAVPAAPARCL